MKIVARTVILLGCLAVTGFAGIARAQEGATKKPATPSEAALANWNDIGNRLVKMAEDWPEDKYTYRPNADVRTFQEVLLHVAGSNYGLINGVSGKKMGDEKNDPAVSDYKTKAQTVEFLKKSVSDGAAEIKREGDAGVSKNLSDWIGYIEHMGEHYGLLVGYYRVNGVVPPSSRK